jgi:hydroxypyruvate reductase
VTVRHKGRGGRNTEFLAGLALGLGGAAGVFALAGDTDGIDGSEDNAGAIVTPETLARAGAKGLDAAALLAANDSYRLFAALGDLVVTGPTLTNVNDFRAILITRDSEEARQEFAEQHDADHQADDDHDDQGGDQDFLDRFKHRRSYE